MHRFRLIAAVAGVVLLAGACSNSSKSSPSQPTGSTTPGGPFANLVHVAAPDPCVLDPGMTASEIKIGVVAPLTGPQAASFSDAVNGIKARVEQANSAKEAGARKITLVVRDDTADQTKNLQQVRDLVENAKVWMVIEVTSASSGGATTSNEHGIPVTGWHVGVPAWSTIPTCSRSACRPRPTRATCTTTATRKIMKGAGVTKIALVGGGNAQSVDYLKRAKESFKADGGLEVVYDNENVPAGTTDFTAEAQRIKDSGADGVLTGMDFIPNTNLSAQLAKDGVVLKVLQFPGGYDSRVLSLPGMEGAVVRPRVQAVRVEPARVPGVRQGDAEGRGAQPGELHRLVVRRDHAAGHQGRGRRLVRPARRSSRTCGSSTRTRGRRVRSGRPREGVRQRVRCVYYVKVVNKKFVPQYGGEQQCGNPIHF